MTGAVVLLGGDESVAAAVRKWLPAGVGLERLEATAESAKYVAKMRPIGVIMAGPVSPQVTREVALVLASRGRLRPVMLGEAASASVLPLVEVVVDKDPERAAKKAVALLANQAQSHVVLVWTAAAGSFLIVAGLVLQITVGTGAMAGIIAGGILAVVGMVIRRVRDGRSS